LRRPRDGSNGRLRQGLPVAAIDGDAAWLQKTLTVLSAGAAAYADAFSRTLGSDKPRPNRLSVVDQKLEKLTRFGRRPAPSDIDRQAAQKQPHV
jgi:hypothetical protein